MLETGYPHGDGTRPHARDVIERYRGWFPAQDLRMMCSENAARLYRHRAPEPVLPRG
ncbi:hypothetical protein ACFWPH_20940 [Nocardia sp. NPDC058499]|uniref:hypothetical protein n=1 Tax=Nocardia sp. NPDC058499 TaxID=3346530 RepID=UPI003653A179